jgi:L-seryl-tRNA(Ser) seleniumtransferase
MLARRRSLPLIDNVASGAFIDFSAYGLGISAQVLESVRAGTDLVLASGDKLLGGPQCGILLGRRSLLDEIVSQPLYRALRIDKLRLAALAATLRLLKDLELAERSLPVIALLSTPLANLKQRAERIAPQITATRLADALVVESQSRILGSRLASQTLPTICISLQPQSRTVEQLAAELRTGATPVLGRIEDGRLLLDLRSVPPREDLAVVAAFEALRPVSESGTTTSAALKDDSEIVEPLAD